MNERIFKLALKAMDFQGAVDIDTELKLTNSELAKFAELIVRECIGIVEKNESEIHYDTGMYPAYPTATVREILEHFGVEE
jgi:hypothetical protein